MILKNWQTIKFQWPYIFMRENPYIHISSNYEEKIIWRKNNFQHTFIIFNLILQYSLFNVFIANDNNFNYCSLIAELQMTEISIKHIQPSLKMNDNFYLLKLLPHLQKSNWATLSIIKQNFSPKLMFFPKDIF